MAFSSMNMNTIGVEGSSSAGAWLQVCNLYVVARTFTNWPILLSLLMDYFNIAMHCIIKCIIRNKLVDGSPLTL